MSNSGKGGNVYNQSANALAGAGGAYQSAADMYGNPGLTGNAAISANPATIASGISNYMNPYTQNVIDRSLLNINRLNDMQLNQVGADATTAGAFGGARHGIVEALTNAESQRTAGDLSANLLNQAFGQAAQFSAQDIANLMGNNQFNALQKNAWSQAKSADEIARAGGMLGAGGAAQGLGGLLYGVGNDITNQQMQAGGLQQQLIQQIMGGAQGQYQQFMNQPQNLLNMQLQALGMNPLNNAVTQTSSYTPGLLDFLSLGAQGLGAWRQTGTGTG